MPASQITNAAERVALIRSYAESIEAIMSAYRPEIDAAARRLELARAEARQIKETSLALS